MSLSIQAWCMAFALLGISYKAYKWRRVRELYRSIPQHLNRVPISPSAHIGFMLTAKRWFTNKHDDFTDKGWNVVGIMSPFPKTESVVYIADANVTKEITSNRIKYPKPTWMYTTLEVYGKNLISLEGEDWKRHRRISQPAFSEKNNRLVWNAAQAIMNELYDDVWGSQESIFIKHFLDTTIHIAVMVLSVAAFGKETSWSTAGNIPKGHTMDFTSSLYIVSTKLVASMVIPSWLLNVTENLRRIKAAFKELGDYIDEMIEERKHQNSHELEGRHDLLTNLLAASEDENLEKNVDGGAAPLTQSELRGNVFVYLIAGHETTAHTLAYAIGLLALYQEEQAAVYQHIKSMVGNREPTYDDFPNLTRILAVFNEALRMFPPVHTIAKHTMEDATWSVSSSDPESSEKRQMFIPAGTCVVMNTPALHYNPRYWPDPFTFKPERFFGDWDRDAFLPFSGGPRACIGRKFAEVESVSVLTSLISRYSIHLAPAQEAEFTGLTVHEKTDRLLRSELRITLTPSSLPLVFKKR